jgi:hypothetical protein
MTVHRVMTLEWIVPQARLVPSPSYNGGEGTTNGYECYRLELFEE